MVKDLFTLSNVSSANCKSPRLESTKGLGPSRLNHMLLKRCSAVVVAVSLMFCGHCVLMHL